MKKILTIILCGSILTLLTPIIMNATTSFDQVTLFTAYEKLDSIAADIDNDGDLDLVALGLGERTVVWYENVGNGSYQNVHPLMDESKYDEDGNEIYDITIWYDTYNNTSWSVGTPSSGVIESGDLDGDGDVDLIMSVSTRNTFFFLENLLIEGNVTNDEVTFANPVEFTGTSPDDIELMDIDNDGFLDVVIGASAASISWFENKLDSDEGFATKVVINSESTNNYVEKLMTVDVNGDSYKDVLYYVNDSGEWNDIEEFRLLINNGDGTFATSTLLDTYTYIGNIDVGDYNGDNVLDFLISAADRTYLYTGSNSGGTYSWTKSDIDVSSTVTTLAFFIDIDEDGYDDVMCGYKQDNNYTYVYYYKYDSGTSSFLTPVFAGGITTLRNKKVADLDGDGYSDIYYRSLENTEWYKNDGDLTFSFRTVTDQVGYIEDTVFIDLNNDSYDDMVAIGNDGQVSWAANMGDGTFDTYMNIIKQAHRDYVPRIMFGADDLNEDGATDILGNLDYYNLSWIKNNNDGTFSDLIVIRDEGSNYIYDYKIADLDGDGDKDIVSTGYNTIGVELHINDGEENFTDSEISSIGGTAILLLDVDNDEDLDVVCFHTAQDKISWYENKLGDDSTFNTEHVLIASVANPRRAAITNLNDDQLEDIIYAGDDLVSLTNNGDGTFTSTDIEVGLTGNARKIFSIDYDRDSDLDIILNVQYGFGTAWYDNNAGVYTKNIVSSNDEIPGMADIDNNGIYEITGYTSSSITAYMTTIASTVQLDDLSTPTNLVDVSNTVYGQPMPTASAGTDNSPDQYHSFAGYYSQADGQGTKYYDENMDSAFNWDKKVGAVLYAYYKPNDYTITFEENGGDELSDLTVAYNSSLSIPEGTKSGMGFDGWYTDSSLTTEFTATTMPPENVTLYAKWIQLYDSIPLIKTLHVEIPTEITTRVGEGIDIPINAYSLYGYYKDDMTNDVVITGSYDVNKVGEYELTYSLVNDGLTTSETVVIKVIDIEAPVISFDRPDEVYRNRYYEYVITATDNYDGDVEVELSVEELSYSVMVTATAVDSSGNSTSQKYEIPLTIAEKIVIPIIIEKHQKILIFDESELDLETIELLYQWNFEQPETDSEWWLKYENFIQIEHGDLFIKAVDAEGSSKIIEVDTTYLPVYEEEVEIEEPVAEEIEEEPVAEEIEEEAEVEEEIEEPETTPEVVEEESSLSLGVILASIGSVAALAVIMYRFKK